MSADVLVEPRPGLAAPPGEECVRCGHPMVDHLAAPQPSDRPVRWVCSAFGCDCVRVDDPTGDHSP